MWYDSIMKQILKDWKSFSEGNEQEVVTFDFDDTLSLSHWDDEVDWWVHDGPHDAFIDKLNQYLTDPSKKVLIVTSRFEDKEQDSLEHPDKMAVQEFLDKYNIKVDGIHFTNGQPKIETLLSLKSTIHHDDDPGDIIDARNNDIEAVVSDPYDDYKDLESQELKDRGTEDLEEHTEPYQREVQRTHKKSKIRLIGKGKNSYNVGGKMKRPSYKRSKSAPPME